MRIDFQHPPIEPTLLAEGFISSPINERDFALSPDGNEVYYTISTPQSTYQTIVFSQKDKAGNWSTPQVTFQKINQSTLNGTGNIYWVSFDKVLQAGR